MRLIWVWTLSALILPAVSLAEPQDPTQAEQQNDPHPNDDRYERAGVTQEHQELIKKDAETQAVERSDEVTLVISGIRKYRQFELIEEALEKAFQHRVPIVKRKISRGSLEIVLLGPQKTISLQEVLDNVELESGRIQSKRLSDERYQVEIR